MIYIVIRKTLDWTDETTFQMQIPDQVRAGVNLWNATFNIPYHEFRAELKRIAQINLSKVRNATLAKHNEVPYGAVAVPVDDDDWLSPELAQTLDRNWEDRIGCYWPSRFLEVTISFPHQLGLVRKLLFPSTKPRWLCTTNNYAVVYSPETADLLKGHIRASHWFLANPNAIMRIEQPLSIMNRTLASITQLRSRPSRSALIRKYRRYGRLYTRASTPDLPWCKPYLDMMAELYARLRLR